MEKENLVQNIESLALNSDTLAKQKNNLINIDLLDEITKLANNSTPEATLKKLEAIMKTRTNLAHNSAPLLTVEALMVQLK